MTPTDSDREALRAVALPRERTSGAQPLPRWLRRAVATRAGRLTASALLVAAAMGATAALRACDVPAPLPADVWAPAPVRAGPAPLAAFLGEPWPAVGPDGAACPFDTRSWWLLDERCRVLIVVGTSDRRLAPLQLAWKASPFGTIVANYLETDEMRVVDGVTWVRFRRTYP